jgi:hypothetical protein
MEHWRYSAADPTDPRFHAKALIEEGELLVDVQTELESGERSAVLNEAEQLRRMLAHFFLGTRAFGSPGGMVRI